MKSLFKTISKSETLKINDTYVLLQFPRIACIKPLFTSISKRKTLRINETLNPYYDCLQYLLKNPCLKPYRKSLRKTLEVNEIRNYYYNVCLCMFFYQIV